MSDQEKLLPLGNAVLAATGKAFHRNTIANWRRDGSLACVRVGKRWHTTIANVEKMIHEQTLAANPNSQ